MPCRLDACGYCSRVRLQSWRFKSSLAAQPWSVMSDRGHLKLWVCLCVANLLFTPATSDGHMLPLNTLCSSDNGKSNHNYNVEENKSFHLQFHNGNRSSHTVVCTLNFETERKNSRLCVLQRHAKLDCGSSVKIQDGDAPTNSLTITCDYSPKSVEWCTTESSLKVNLTLSKSTHMVLDMLLYDIRSKHRTVYMDNIPYCGSRFELDSSVVNVSGRMAPHRNVSVFFSSCILTFDYVGDDKNKTLCLIYYPLKEGTDCTSDLEYKLVVMEKKQVSKTIIICEERSQIKWCSSSTELKLYLYRSPEKTHTRHTEHFSLQIRDITDTEEFLNETGTSFSQPREGELSGASSVKYSIRCVIILAVIAVFSLLCPRATINGY